MDNNINHTKIKKSSQFWEIENPIIRYRDRQNHNLENLEKFLTLTKYRRKSWRGESKQLFKSLPEDSFPLNNSR